MFGTFANQTNISKRNKGKTKYYLNFLLRKMNYFIYLINMRIKESAISVPACRLLFSSRVKISKKGYRTSIELQNEEEKKSLFLFLFTI